MTWTVGDRLTHRLNPDLGPGFVVEVEGRTVVVEFPNDGTTLRLAADSRALAPLVLRPGTPVRLIDSGESAVVKERDEEGWVRLEDGREVEEHELWPIDLVDEGSELIARLAAGRVDRAAAFLLRLDSMRLAAMRTADGLGSFLGGRIRLFPHQLYIADRATQSHPVRWLLADEVGLGKTVESCLVLNHLLRTGRAQRTLVVAPETLTVQWLGELWRKYHQIFVLLDDKRLQDVEKDYGQGFNPFDAYPQVVISQERLEASPRLTEQAVAAGVDLLVVDEAHHLRRPPGHPGNASYRSIAPIAANGRHVLLLTAVPLEDDAHGFFRLLQLLRPDYHPDAKSFEARLRKGTPLPPCTSATRRIDIGGLPPRRGNPVELSEEAWGAQDRLVARLRRLEAKNELERSRLQRGIFRAEAMATQGGELLEPLCGSTEAKGEIRELATAAEAEDPRVEWLLEQVRRWQRSGDKTLVFVAEQQTLEILKDALNRRAGQRIGLFHEQLSSKQRDIEVAQFRLPSGPSLLVSTECGGEGRNFEFCTRLVLFDLPWSPMVVEQRIGRLDRIGRRLPVEIVYFRRQRGLASTVVRLYERLGLFERPLGSFETELRGVEAAVAELALSGPDEGGDDARFEVILAEAQKAYDRVEQAAFHELHRDPYRPEMAADILARVPAGLEELTRDVVVAACRELGLQVEEHTAGRRHWIELDARARIESLPGIVGEASFLGSFFREEAVEDETIDFFASGHPLVEGLLSHLEESALGRVALLHVPDAAAERTFGLLAVYRDGLGFRAVAIDSRGRERDDLRDLLLARPLRTRPVRARDWVEQATWSQGIHKLGRHLEGRGQPVALAAFRLG